MGLGIGFDVVLGTFSRIKYLTPETGWLWVRRIAFTHICFPMIGYYGFIELFYLFPYLRILLGIVAFGLIVYFLIDIVKGWLEKENETDETHPFAWAVVLTVSWDALFSGPAKSSQALNWNQTEVFLSFVFAGLVVTILAITAVQISFFIQRITKATLNFSTDKLVFSQLFMMFAEFVIFTYFGLLALIRYSFSSELSATYIWIISTLIGIVLFVVIWRYLLPNIRNRVMSELPNQSKVNQT
jgi:hypothetical protein